MRIISAVSLYNTELSFLQCVIVNIYENKPVWSQARPRAARKRAFAAGSWLSTRNLTRRGARSGRLGEPHIQWRQEYLLSPGRDNRPGFLHTEPHTPGDPGCRKRGYENPECRAGLRTFLLPPLFSSAGQCS